MGRGAAVVALAVGLALTSSHVERVGPEQKAYGNLCGPSLSELCMEPVRTGGFPFGYLVDRPGVSRERALAFVEDETRPLPLALNVAFYAAALLGAGLWLGRRRRAA